MILLCECCNQPIERFSDIKLTHRNGCEPEASKVSKSAPDTEIQKLPDGRMDVYNAAKYLGYSSGTLDNWRVTGDGPNFQKINGKVFYTQEALDTWVNAHTGSRTTAQARFKSQL